MVGLLIMAVRKLVAAPVILSRAWRASRRSWEAASWLLVAVGGVLVAAVIVARTALIDLRVVTPRPGVGVLDVAAIILLSIGALGALGGFATAVLLAVRSVPLPALHRWEHPTSRTPAEVLSWIFLALGGLLVSISVAAVAAAPPGDAVIGAAFIFLAGVPPLLLGLLIMAVHKITKRGAGGPK